jgi:hypothetical protein
MSSMEGRHVVTEARVCARPQPAHSRSSSFASAAAASTTSASTASAASAAASSSAAAASRRALVDLLPARHRGDGGVGWLRMWWAVRVAPPRGSRPGRRLRAIGVVEHHLPVRQRLVLIVDVPVRDGALDRPVRVWPRWRRALLVKGRARGQAPQLAHLVRREHVPLLQPVGELLVPAGGAQRRGRHMEQRHA